MLPPLRQRLIIAAGTALCALAWLAVLPWLGAADGSRGVALLDPRAGWGVALGLWLLATLASAVIAAVVAATAQPLAGVFAAAAGLTVMAGWAGPIDGWLLGERRAAALWTPSAHAYFRLLGELVLWQATLLAVGVATGPTRAVGKPSDGGAGPEGEAARETPAHAWLQTVAAGLLAAAVAGVAGCLLLRSSDAGQVLCSLVLAFLLGAAAGQGAFTAAHPAGVLASPLVVGAAAYGYVIATYPTYPRFLAAWFGREALGVALVLPVFYASAAVMGATLGLGLVRRMVHAEEEHPTGKADRMATALGGVLGGVFGRALAEHGLRLARDRARRTAAPPPNRKEP